VLSSESSLALLPAKESRDVFAVPPIKPIVAILRDDLVSRVAQLRLALQVQAICQVAGNLIHIVLQDSAIATLGSRDRLRLPGLGVLNVEEGAVGDQA